MFNPYIILAVALFWGGSLYWSYNKGQEVCEHANQAAALEHREKENALLVELEKAKAERSVVYRDRIKIVEKSPDPTGCLDTPFDPEFIRGLRGG